MCLTGVAGAYAAAGLTSEAAQKPVVIPVAAATKGALAVAASQQNVVTALRGPLPAPSPALLQEAALQASGPLRLANPDAAARDLDCLTAAVYYEARGESREGQAAVAQVVLNRMHSPAFPNTVCGVVYQGAASGACQFSFACDGAASAHRERGAWDRARKVASRALNGYVMSGLRGATHFHVASLGPVWGDGLVRIAQIGQHVFYGFAGHRHGAHNVSVAAAAPSTPAPADAAAPVKLAGGPTAVAATQSDTPAKSATTAS